MKKTIGFAMIASALFSSCTKIQDDVNVSANYDYVVTGVAPTAEVSFVNRSVSAVSYNWNFGTTYSGPDSNVTARNPKIRVDKAGNITVTLTAKNGTNSDMITKTITVK